MPLGDTDKIRTDVMAIKENMREISARVEKSLQTEAKLLSVSTWADPSSQKYR